jgi:hypothetical protein
MTFHKRAFDLFSMLLHIDDNFYCATMNCQRNVNSIVPTQLPDKFSYIVAILIHNHFESLNIKNIKSDHVNTKTEEYLFKKQLAHVNVLP